MRSRSGADVPALPGVLEGGSIIVDLTKSAVELADQLNDKLGQFSGLIRHFPPDNYLELCLHGDATQYCRDLPKAQVTSLHRLTRKFGQAAASLYNQRALVLLSLKYLESDEHQALPAPVAHLTQAWFAQIYRDIQEKSPDHFDLLQPAGRNLDDLKLDFAVCAGRAIPVGGAWIVERRRLVAKKLFVRADSYKRPVVADTPGLYQKLKRVAVTSGTLDSLVFLRSKWHALTGRYGDYLVIHTADRYRRYFSEKYLDQAYRNIALLLQQDSKLLGLYRSSWFLDPKVVEMEPKLAFLSRTPVANGARYGPVKAVEDRDLAMVLSRSPVRAGAYQRGEYRPWAWAYLWSREDVLAWADRDSHPAAQEQPK